MNQDSQLEFETLDVGGGLKGALRTGVASDEREVQRLKHEIGEFKKQEKQLLDKWWRALRKDARAYVDDMLANVCKRVLKERAQAGPAAAAAELQVVLHEVLPVDTFQQEPGEHVNFIEQRDSLGTGTQSSQGADQEPS